MSGADEDEEAGPPGLPPGTPFYMTPAGAAALRAEPATSRIPILMITSRFSPTHRDRAMAAGVDVFLSKPYDEDELATHVRACLERGRRLG